MSHLKPQLVAKNKLHKVLFGSSLSDVFSVARPNSINDRVTSE